MTALMVISIITMIINIFDIVFLCCTNRKIEVKSLWIFLINLVPCLALTITASIHTGEGVWSSIITSTYDALSFYKFAFPLAVEEVAEENILFLFASFLTCVSTTFNYIIFLFKALIKDRISIRKVKKNADKPHYILLGEFLMMKQVCESLDLDAVIIIEEGNRPEKGFNLSIDEIKNIIDNDKKNEVRNNQQDENSKNSKDSKEKYQYIFTKDIEEAMITSGIDNDNIKVISLYEDINKTLKLIQIADKHLKSSSSLLINTDLKNLKLENKSYDVRYFDVHDLVANYFIMNYPLYSYLPEEFIDKERAYLTPDKEINHFFIGTTKDTFSLIKNIELNYLPNSLHFNATVFGNKDIIDEIELLNTNNNYAKTVLNNDQNKNKYYDIFYIRDNINCYNLDGHIIDYCLKNEKDFNFFYVDLEDDELNYSNIMILLNEIKNKLKGQCKIFVKNIKSNEIKLTLENNGIIVVNIDDTVLSKQFLIDEKLDNVAKKVHYHYMKDDKYTIEELWNKAEYNNKESSRQSVNNIVVKLSLLGLKLSEQGNNNISEKEYFKYIQIKTEEEVKNFNYDEYNKVNDIPYYNLALQEHNRWCAYEMIIESVLPLEKNKIFELKDNNIIFTRNIKEKNICIKHGNLCTNKGLFDLVNDIKTKDNVLYPGSSKEREASVFKKDMDVIDNLYDILEGTGYYVSKE